MEKNGALKEGSPSVVSGEPSDHVDENGEPVSGQEKSASVDTKKVLTLPAKENV